MLSLLLRAVALMFFLALLVVVILELGNYLLLKRSPPLDQLGIVPGFLQRLWPALGALKFDESAVLSLLATFVQVAGVFLGLYFTAVSMVLNTYVSSGAAASVRYRLVHELSRNGYISLIALFGAVSTLLLAGTTVNLQPGLPSLVVVTILGIVSIIGFVVLGLRSFSYLDPANLAAVLPGRLSPWIEAATASGHRWTDPAIQDYYRRQAESITAIYREVADFAMTGNRSSPDSISGLARSALWIMRRYSTKKLRIPTTSNWFERVNRHRSWLTVSEDHVIMLIEADWQGEPELIPDPLWFERKMEPIVGSSLEVLAKSGQLNAAADVISAAHQVLQVMGNNYSVEEALRLLDTIATAIESAIRSTPLEIATLDQDRTKSELVLGLHELLAIGLTPIILGLTRAIEMVSLSQFRDSVARIQWDREETIYGLTAPRYVIEQTELFAKRLAFERAVEGKMVTPFWYQQQFVARNFVAYLDSVVTLIADRFESTFPSAAERYVQEGQYLLALQLIARGLEAHRRLTLLIAEATTCSENLTSLRRIPEEPWPTIQWTDKLERAKRARRRLTQVLGRCTPFVASAQRPSSDWPDFFGHAYRLIANECADALDADDEELFADLFPAFLFSSMAAHDRLMHELQNAAEPAKTIFSSEPLADLLQLSGLARMYGELDGKNYWATVQRSWDEYLENAQNSAAVVLFLATTIRYRESAFAIPPYQGIRTGWQKRLEWKLRERGLLTNGMFNPYPRPSAQVNHTSALIRAIVSGHPFLFVSPIDVFIVIYLKQRPEGVDLKLERMQISFEQRLLREQELG